MSMPNWWHIIQAKKNHKIPLGYHQFEKRKSRSQREQLVSTKSIAHTSTFLLKTYWSLLGKIDQKKALSAVSILPPSFQSIPNSIVLSGAGYNSWSMPIGDWWHLRFAHIWAWRSTTWPVVPVILRTWRVRNPRQVIATAVPAPTNS